MYQKCSGGRQAAALQVRRILTFVFSNMLTPFAHRAKVDYFLKYLPIYSVSAAGGIQCSIRKRPQLVHARTSISEKDLL